MTQRMILNETAWFGAGALRHLPEEVQRRGMRKALIVTDKALVAAGALKRVTDLLAQHQLDWAVYDEVVPNPTIRFVQQGVAVFRESGADYLIAIGGAHHRIPARRSVLLSITLSLKMSAAWKASAPPVIRACRSSPSRPRQAPPQK